MSVIFKTLKKLKTGSPYKENIKNKVVAKKRIYFFKKALYSPSYLFLFLLISTVIGTGTIYGYYYLRESKIENIKDFSIPDRNIQKSTDISNVTILDDKDSKGQKDAKEPAVNEIKYFEPQSINKESRMYTSNKTDEIKAPLVIEKKPSLKSNGGVKKDVAARLEREKVDKTSLKEISQIPEVEKIFLENAKKNSRIARLVMNIRWEMEHGNDNRIEKLFDDLTALKGQNNAYVLKLKAVWYIHKKEFERAEDLLQKVLIKNGNDQEAGINMAIIEIGTQHMEEAYQRLKKLQTIYPENLRIVEIMQNMKPMLNKTHTHHLNRNKKS